MSGQQHRRECPTCGRVTACTVEIKPIGAPRTPPRFRPHNDPATGKPCPQGSTEKDDW